MVSLSLSTTRLSIALGVNAASLYNAPNAISKLFQLRRDLTLPDDEKAVFRALGLALATSRREQLDQQTQAGVTNLLDPLVPLLEHDDLTQCLEAMKMSVGKVLDLTCKSCLCGNASLSDLPVLLVCLTFSCLVVWVFFIVDCLTYYYYSVQWDYYFHCYHYCHLDCFFIVDCVYPLLFFYSWLLD